MKTKQWMAFPIYLILGLGVLAQAGDPPLLSAQSAKLIPSQADWGQGLGQSVAVNGDHAVVGAPGAYGRTGAVLIFDRNLGGTNQWGLRKVIAPYQFLAPADPPKGFGYAVALDGDRLVVGWPDIASHWFGSHTPLHVGRVISFERNFGGTDNWGQVAVAQSPTAFVGDGFGTTVAVDGNTLAVGEVEVLSTVIIGDPVDIGRVHVMEWTGAAWSYRKTIFASDSGGGDRFGEALDLEGDRLAIGAPRNDDAGLSSGSAYIYGRNAGGVGNWGEVRKIVALDAVSNAQFGVSVSLGGPNLAVGAASPVSRGTDACYLFQENRGGVANWGQFIKHSPPVQKPYSLFGASVQLQGGLLAVGAPGPGLRALLPGLDLDDADGSVFMYQQDAGGPGAWGLYDTLRMPADGSGNGFGTVALNQGDLLVGAPADDHAGPGSGLATLWKDQAGGAGKMGFVKSLLYEDRGIEDRFGSAVAVFEDTAVVGSPRATRANPFIASGSNEVGAVYVYTRDYGGLQEWGFSAKIEPGSTVRAFDQFGSAVCLHSNLLVVGTPFNDGASGDMYNQGLATIYERPEPDSETWDAVRHLRPSNGSTNDNFGAAVAIYGDVAVVGAPKQDAEGLDAGALYVFLRDKGGSNNWGEAGMLAASDAKPGARFGSSLSLDRDFLIVGAPFDSTLGPNAGAAYLIPFTGGEKKLLAGDGRENQQYGYAVCTRGSYAVVGAYGDDQGGAFSGAAYLYWINWGGVSNWGQVKKLVPADPAPGQVFGASVAIHKANLVVGAPLDDEAATDAGAVYTFQWGQGGNNQWGQTEKFTAGDATPGSFLGISLAQWDTTFVAGALGESSTIRTNAGAAYVFDPVLADILEVQRSGTNTALKLRVNPGRTYRYYRSDDLQTWTGHGAPFTPSDRYWIQPLPGVPDPAASTRFFQLFYTRP